MVDVLPSDWLLLEGPAEDGREPLAVPAPLFRAALLALARATAARLAAGGDR